MNRLPLRILASALIAAIPLWSPAVPRALAELEPGVLEQCRTEIANDPTLDPAVREIALGDVLPKLEEAASPDASREAKTELAAVEETAKQIVVASNTAAELPLPDRAALTAVVTQQSGVADTEVAQVVGQIEDKLKLGKEALAQGNFADAEKQFGELQKLCHDRGIDPGVFARSNEGLDFGRIAFDPAGDYVGKVIESHIVVESWRDLSGQTGLPDYQAGGLDIGMDRSKMLDQINAMEVSAEEKTKMLETYHAIEGYLKEGDLASVDRLFREQAEKMYQEALEKGWTPEMMQEGVGPMGSTGMEHYGPMPMEAMSSSGGITGPELAQITEFYGAAGAEMTQGIAVDQEGNIHYVETSGATEVKTTDVTNNNYDYKQETHPACDTLTAEQLAEHQAHGHCP